jgi:hypothetical protein
VTYVTHNVKLVLVQPTQIVLPVQLLHTYMDPNVLTHAQMVLIKDPTEPVLFVTLIVPLAITLFLPDVLLVLKEHSFITENVLQNAHPIPITKMKITPVNHAIPFALLVAVQHTLNVIVVIAHTSSLKTNVLQDVILVIMETLPIEHAENVNPHVSLVKITPLNATAVTILMDIIGNPVYMNVTNHAQITCTEMILPKNVNLVTILALLVMAQNPLTVLLVKTVPTYGKVNVIQLAQMEPTEIAHLGLAKPVLLLVPLVLVTVNVHLVSPELIYTDIAV